jgi:predicted nucleotide-binding protein (sugar kinase/HSP70/actin superfamily)
MARYERAIRSVLSRSGLVDAHVEKVEGIIDNARPYVSPHHTGEAILTVGSALTEVALRACGVIAIGPFGCMPNRIAEAVLSEIMNRDARLALDPGNACLRRVLEETDALPFLAIESDGSAFPQVINARLEAFCLQAERLHGRMQTCIPKPSS